MPTRILKWLPAFLCFQCISKRDTDFGKLDIYIYSKAMNLSDVHISEVGGWNHK